LIRNTLALEFVRRVELAVVGVPLLTLFPNQQSFEFVALLVQPLKTVVVAFLDPIPFKLV